MNAQTQVSSVSEAPRRSLLVDMAMRYGMEPKAFADTLRATVVPKETTNEEFAAFLLVAKEYDLNPLLKEIYAFPKKGGGIQPIVSVDGWCNLVNSHSMLNGIEFDDHLDKDGKVTSITARIWRKDRDKPIIVTEYMSECVRSTDTWKQYPRRMLRHKALIQCARYAFGFAGIVDPDEAERMAEPARAINIRDDGPPAPPQRVTDQSVSEVEAPNEPDQNQTAEAIDPNLANWRKDAEGALAGCEDAESLFRVRETVIMPAKGKVFPPDWQAVASAYRQAFDRIGME